MRMSELADSDPGAPGAGSPRSAAWPVTASMAAPAAAADRASVPAYARSSELCPAATA